MVNTHVLLNKNCLRHLMIRIQSKDHRIGTYEINKIFFSCFNDKIYSQNNGFNGLWEKLFCQVKNFILIFILTRTTFLSSYEHYFQSSQNSFFFLQSTYKMVDSKTLKISIWAIIKDRPRNVKACSWSS